jgi:opacity protein-like surface antigen
MARPIVFMLATLIALSSATVAQTRVGFHVGTQVSTLTRPTHGDADWNWIGKTFGGIVFDVRFANRLLLAVQLDWNQKWTGLNDSPFTEPGSYTGVHTTLKTDYLDMPIYIRWRPADSAIRWFVDVGPKLSFLLSSRVDMSALNVADWTRDVEQQLRRTDIGVAVGTGVEIDVAKSVCLTCAAHYTHGLVGVFQGSSNDSKVIGVQAGIGVMIVM